ncbi:MAG: hypothetical protein OXU74_17100 [Gemmatimonadota bacterium]|nr:hypothetical protein [Gemmatimonadota bacterium]
MQLGTVFTVAAVLALFAAPVAGQESTDTTVYFHGEGMPVWVMVEDDAENAGAHRVLVAVKWADYRSTLPFSHEVGPGDLTVFLPKTDNADDVDPNEACRFTSAQMDHGSEYMHLAERADTDCLAPPVEFMPLIGIEYVGAAGAAMACTPATRDDGTEDPAIRYYGCYWSAPPNEG